MAINLDPLLQSLIVNIILNVLIITPLLWISGRLIAGKQKAKFTDALWIVLLGTLVSMVFGYFFQGLIASIILFILWLALVKHFFDSGWLKLFAISIVAVLIFIAIVVILGLVGFTIISWLPTGINYF